MKTRYMEERLQDKFNTKASYITFAIVFALIVLIV